MLTKRQNFMETIRGGNPDRFVNQWEAYELIMDPITMECPVPMPGEPDRPDGFGVWFSWPEDQPGAYPIHTPDKIVIKDITKWREQVIRPQIEFSDEKWAPYVEQANAVNREEKFCCSFVAPGIFERCHHLMGISECLMAFYEHPEEMHELIDWLTDYELDMAREICEHIHPDALFHHDDWGSYDSTFLRPEMFDEFFLPAYKKVYGYYKDHGVELIIHHSDSFAATLVPEMIEMGIDVWQGTMLSNDIPGLIEKYRGKISFQGGLENALIDIPEWTREKIDETVKRVCEDCGALYFIPSLCAGGASSVVPPVFDETTKAIEDFNAEEFDVILAQSRARVEKWSEGDDAGSASTDEAGAADDAASGLSGTLGELYQAVLKGQKKKAVSLTERAVAEGTDAQEVLDTALVPPMDEIGAKFSAGEAFVPEMLVAAGAMAACTEVLKPHLGEGSGAAAGHAVIGTVQGDMHDIGKNLVRMMIESKGVRIDDLGVDVAPEAFVDYLKAHPECDVVCLSALLTTTMPAMEATVRAIEEAGLRGQVRIMVGGAPVTAAFAEKIGADAYTEDAGGAANEILRQIELLPADVRAAHEAAAGQETGVVPETAPAAPAAVESTVPAASREHTPLDMSGWDEPKHRDMRAWVAGQIAAPAKKALPVLSFPAIQDMGVTVRELLSIEYLQAHAMREVAERWDCAASLAFMDLSVEAEAFGASVVWSDDEVPTVVGSIVSTEADLEKLWQPVVGDGRTGTCVKAVRRAAGLVDDRPVLAGCIGPFSLTGRLMDVNEVMVKCMEEPELVKAVLERATGFLVEYVSALKAAGADGVVLAEPMAGLLQAELVGEFSSEYVRRIVDAVQDDSFIVVYHNCGPSVVKAADAVIATGVAAYHFGNAVDMADILPLMPSDALVMGNVDPAGEVRNGTPESVRTATLALMEKCAGYPNFVPSTGCDVPPMSSWANIDAFFDAVEEFYVK